MRVALFAVLADNTAVVELVLTQEALRVVVAVDVDLGEGVVRGWLLDAVVDARLQPWHEQLQAVALLNLHECTERENQHRNEKHVHKPTSRKEQLCSMKSSCAP